MNAPGQVTAALKYPGDDPSSNSAPGELPDFRARAGSIAQLKYSVLEHLPLLITIFLYAIASLLVRIAYGLEARQPFDLLTAATAAQSWLYLAFSAVAVYHVFHFLVTHILRRRRRGEENAELSWGMDWIQYRRHRLPIERFSGLVIAGVALAFLMTTFVAFKRVIPEVHYFTWDVALMRLDWWLHFGHHPWELLQPVLGRPGITLFLDFVYYLWFPLGLFMVIWQAWTADRTGRAQFLLTYALCWILLGSVTAVLFSSVGPVYYGRVTGLADPYSPLMAYLYEVQAMRPLTALSVQEYLWEGYAGLADHPIEGIAAMPSLHVAMAVLFALAAYRRSYLLGVALAIFAALTLIGSVALGWHYAVDGYVSILFVLVCWSLVGRFVGWYDRWLHGPSSRLTSNVA